MHFCGLGSKSAIPRQDVPYSEVPNKYLLRTASFSFSNSYKLQTSFVDPNESKETYILRDSIMLLSTLRFLYFFFLSGWNPNSLLPEDDK